MQITPDPALPKKSLSRTKEFWTTIQYFFGFQIFAAVMMLSFSMGGQAIFGAIMGIPPLLAWVTGRRKAYLFILYFIFIGFTIGQRTVYIGQYFRIVPSAVILWILGITALFVKSQFRPPQKAVPWSVFILCIASAFAIGGSWKSEEGTNLGFFYAHMMWMSFPAFIVCNRFAQRLENVSVIANILAMSCFFLSLLGIAEYFDLGFIHYFSGFIQGKTMEGQQGGARMAATFWGGPMMAGYLAMAFPLVMAYFFSSKRWIQKLIALLSIVLSFVAIYLSGHRGVWLPVLLGIGVYFYFKGIKGIMILAILVAIGIHFIPEEAKTRLSGLYGEQRDTSSLKREDRARGTWELIKASPVVGHGWGVSGLVHSDFLQIWADAGLAAFLSYTWVYFLVLLKLFSVLRIRGKLFKDYGCGFFASILTAMGILLQQPWFNLPELYTPFWVIMGLAYQYGNIVWIEKKIALAEHQAQVQAQTGKSHA